MSISAPRPPHAFNHDSIRPGVVGSVGDVLGSIKLKHSTPQLPIRVEKLSTTVGSNVQDGDIDSYTSHGAQARVKDSNWGGRRAFKTSHGWVMQDIRDQDRLHEPFLESQPSYSWRNKIATTYRAFRTGDMFLPLPGGYNPSPGEIERGQIVPVVTNVEEGEMLAGDTGFPSYQVGGSSTNFQSGFVSPQDQFRGTAQAQQKRYGHMNK